MIDLLIYDSAMIRSPQENPARRARKALSPRAWAGACTLLVLLTWTPVLGLHFRNMAVADPGTGTLVAVFPPTTSSREIFRGIEGARGAPVGPVTWIPRAWIVQSAEAGFAGRLRQQGAWAVYSTNLLSARQLLSCAHLVAPLPSSGAPSS